MSNRPLLEVLITKRWLNPWEKNGKKYAFISNK